MSQTPSLSGRRILLVEDEFLIALDIEMELAGAGADVVCAGRLEEAEALSRDTACDAAILDLDLHGRDSFPVADRLEARGIPFLFHTGHGVRANLTARYPSAVICNKPCSSSELIGHLDRLVTARR